MSNPRHLRRLQPITPPLKRIGRRGHPTRTGSGEHARPIDRCAGLIQPGQRLSQTGVIRYATPQRSQPATLIQRRLAQRGQDRLWPDFQKGTATQRPQRFQSLDKAHRLSGMFPPVTGVKSFPWRSGQVGNQRQAGMTHAVAARRLLQTRQRRLQQRRMKGMGHRQPPAVDTASIQPFGQPVQRREIARYRGIRRAIESRQIQNAVHYRQPRLHRRHRRKHCQHSAAGGQGLHQPPAFRHQRQRLFRGKHARRYRRGIFTDAMAHDRSGSDAPGAPQVRQGQFHRHHQRLRQSGIVDGRLAKQQIERRTT